MDTLKKQNKFLIIFRYAYQEIQNVLKHMILRGNIQNNLQSFRNTYFYESEHSASFSPLRKKNNLLADMGLTPLPHPPRLRTCTHLLVIFTPSLYMQL